MMKFSQFRWHVCRLWEFEKEKQETDAAKAQSLARKTHFEVQASKNEHSAREKCTGSKNVKYIVC